SAAAWCGGCRTCPPTTRACRWTPRWRRPRPRGGCSSSGWGGRPRLNRHSAHPEHGCGEMDEGHEVDGPSVVACGEAPEVFEFIEAALDTVAMTVYRCVVRDDHLSGA